MANRRKTHLDALEGKLTGSKRIALFGHRNVGKTTLLAMFYRQASTGRVPGLRLAAVDAPTAEYLAEKIAQIEAGESLAGTLAETELKLRLYHGPARFDLIVKDYQGEHVTLGSDEPIQQFFADCDAVLLCLDPDGSTRPADRRRRQQEVENLLERYIDRSDDSTAGRPIALLLTKFDRVLAQQSSTAEGEGEGPDLADDPSGWGVEKLVEAQYGMTRHALAQHAPGGAIFAVSSYGHESRDGRPPADLHPLGLQGPLLWLAEQLEANDRDQLDWLWDLAPDDIPRLARCVAAFDRRYPRSDRTDEYRARLKALRRRRTRRIGIRLATAAVSIVAALAGFDAWEVHAALAFERDNAAPAVAKRWARVLDWHPSLPLFWPERAKVARGKLAEWQVKAAEVQVANGTAGPEVRAELVALKDAAPHLAPEIRKVEVAQDLARHDERWNGVKSESSAPGDEPEKPLAAVRQFLRDFPESPRRDEALALLKTFQDQAASRQASIERRAVDDLVRSEGLPDADFRDLIDRSRQFLADHPQSQWRGEVERRIDDYARKLDDADIDRARQYSKQYPTNFATRIQRYQDYLKKYQSGGRFISEATEARDRILREWDTYTYRLAYDHLAAHADDVSEVARRLREYLHDHPEGRYAPEARHYLQWWDKVSVPRDYRVTLLRGEVDPSVGKYLGGGGPDLGVVIEVGGVPHGPCPVVRNTHRPIWNYTFPRPIRWKLGDSVSIRILDYDWSDNTVYTLNSRKGDPLAMRLLSGPIQPAKGGKTSLVFKSDFAPPRLSRPE